MKGLATRVITAIIFVIFMIGGIYLGPYTFAILFTLITGLCLWEFLGVNLPTENRTDQWRKIIGLTIGLLPYLLVTAIQLDLLLNEGGMWWLKAGLLFFPVVFMIFIFELYTTSDKPFHNIAYIILGMIYIGVPFALLSLVAFEVNDYFPNIVLGLLLLTWCNDTMAYFTGSFFGKTKLFPRISPKKTWEGTLGGIAITFVLAYVLSLLFTELTLTNWLVLATIVAIFGSIGDLIESMLKRSATLKDSGSLLPGHGGFLDRFDGFIFLLPFAAAYLLYLR